jgi:hypothetical protein
MAFPPRRWTNEADALPDQSNHAMSEPRGGGPCLTYALISITLPGWKGTATWLWTSQNGELKQCDLQIVETPRFFEAMLRGRPFSDASHITSRICGICAVGHATASLRATEKALGVRAIAHRPTAAPPQLPRRDVGQPRAARLHAGRAGLPQRGQRHPAGQNRPGGGAARPAPEEVGGRHLQRLFAAGTPIQLPWTVGGFSHFPTAADLYDLRERYQAARADVAATVEPYSKPCPYRSSSGTPNSSPCTIRRIMASLMARSSAPMAGSGRWSSTAT